MNWKSTWILIGLAGALLAFILFFERHAATTDAPPARLLAFKAAQVTNIQIRLTNQLLLRVERPRAGALWNYTFPIAYPAKVHAIEWLIQSLEEAVPLTHIPKQELEASRRTIAEFGLDVPQATLTLQHNGERTEVMFGAKTPVGDGVYVQVMSQPDIYVLDAELVKRMPRTYQDWRELGLFTTTGFKMNRVEIRSAGRGFTLDIDESRGSFVLSKPTIARADPTKVIALLQKLLSTQVSQFVSDNPRADLEQYGLQPPEAEVTFLVGSNEQYTATFAVQFGRSPTNDPAVVYARRPTTTNIVLVPKTSLEAVQISHSDVRDLHLTSFPPQLVDSIEVIGAESFTLQRGTNQTWSITEPAATVADTNAVRELLENLVLMEGAVEKDVVTDFTPYGLNTPARRYVIKASLTNAAGVVSNRVIAELALGSVQDNKVFARRPDEATVYSLQRDQVFRLPRETWQLRDRRIWNFTTNEVAKVAVTYLGNSRTLQRSASAAWSIAEGTGIVPSTNPALEETLFRLGNLHAGVWVDRGENKRAVYGFTGNTSKIAIELKNGEKPQTRFVEFGRPGLSPTGLPYALTEIDGQTWVFEFPPTLYFEVVRDLLNPMTRAE